MFYIVNVLGIVAAGYYLGAPARTWLVHRSSANPDPRPVERGALADISAKFMLAGLEPLAQSGFEPVAALELSRQANNAALYVMLVVNEKARDHGMVVAAFGLAGEEVNQSAFFTSFSSRYPDGFFIQTNNSQVRGAFPSAPNSIVNQLPSVKDVTRLYEIHQMIVEQEGRSQPKVLMSEFEGGPVGYLRHSMREELARAQSSGYMRPTADATALRPTIKGAILMTYMHLFPFKAIGSAACRLKERKVLSAARHHGIDV